MMNCSQQVFWSHSKALWMDRGRKTDCHNITSHIWYSLFYYSSFHDELFAAGILKPFQSVMDGQPRRERRIISALGHIYVIVYFYYCSFHEELFTAGILKPFQGVMDGQREKDGSSLHYVTECDIVYFYYSSFWSNSKALWIDNVIKTDCHSITSQNVL